MSACAIYLFPSPWNTLSCASDMPWIANPLHLLAHRKHRIFVLLFLVIANPLHLSWRTESIEYLYSYFSSFDGEDVRPFSCTPLITSSRSLTLYCHTDLQERLWSFPVCPDSKTARSSSLVALNRVPTMRCDTDAREALVYFMSCPLCKECVLFLLHSSEPTIWPRTSTEIHSKYSCVFFP